MSGMVPPLCSKFIGISLAAYFKLTAALHGIYSK